MVLKWLLDEMIGLWNYYLMKLLLNEKTVYKIKELFIEMIGIRNDCLMQQMDYKLTARLQPLGDMTN